jgi:hypothetical protein
MDACSCDKKASDLKAKSKPAAKKNVRRTIADNIKLEEGSGKETRDAIATALKKSHARARAQKTIASGGLGSGRKPTDQDIANKAREFGYKHTGSVKSPYSGTTTHTFSHKDGSSISLSKGNWASHNPIGDGKVNVQSGSTIGGLHDRLSNLHSPKDVTAGGPGSGRLPKGTSVHDVPPMHGFTLHKETAAGTKLWDHKSGSKIVTTDDKKWFYMHHGGSQMHGKGPNTLHDSL